MLLRRTEKFKAKHAVVAQLVEHHLAKVDVASSSLVNRSTKAPRFASGLFVVSGFLSPGGLVFGGAGRESCGLSRGGYLGGLAARLRWLSDDLTARSSDCREVGQEKSSKKIWDAKRAGERVKLLSEPPRSCFEG